MRYKTLIVAAFWIGAAHTALAQDTTWNWLYVYAAKPSPISQTVWFTAQGIARDNAAGSSFDIPIGGTASVAQPNHIDHYELKGSIKGNAVTATLVGIDTDETPQQFSGKLISKAGEERISLISPTGNVILLYRSAAP